MTDTDSLGSLKADLVAMLQAARTAERDLFGRLDPAGRDAPGSNGWSAKDTQAHLAAWRSIEARRLNALASGDRSGLAGDPAPGEPVDVSNDRLHSARSSWNWDQVVRDADESLDALVAAIGRSSAEALASQDGTSAGLGANAAGHAIGHLADVAAASAVPDPFEAYAGDLEAIMGRGRISPLDASVLSYDLACCRALAGDLEAARRLLGRALVLRPELRQAAQDDPDLVAVRGDLDRIG